MFGRVDNTLNKRTFRECLDAIVKLFEEEDLFESLIEFLTKSVEVTLILLTISGLLKFNPNFITMLRLKNLWCTEECCSVAFI